MLKYYVAIVCDGLCLTQYASNVTVISILLEYFISLLAHLHDLDTQNPTKASIVHRIG